MTTSNSTFLESSNEGNAEIDHTTKKPTYVKAEETTVSESSMKLTEIPTTEDTTISTETTSQPVLGKHIFIYVYSNYCIVFLHSFEKHYS